jgi:hypothetical protein
MTGIWLHHYAIFWGYNVNKIRGQGMTELLPMRADCRVESAASDQIDTAVVVPDVAPNSPAQDALRWAISELDAVSRELDEALLSRAPVGQSL